jgi:hypothetical protein
MIAYHGTPIGGNGVEIARFLSGKHALVSYANQQDMAIVAKTCASFVLDNGAFTLWQGGKTPDWDKYYQWVSTWATHPGFDWHLIPDIIDGSEDDNWRLMFHYHKEAAKYSGVPVFHLHESLEHLERMVASYPRIAIGSSGEWPTPGMSGWWARMSEIMHVVCDNQGHPRCRLHGLRMLNPDVFKRLPLSSADSCNCGRNNGNTERWKGCYTDISSSQRAEVLAWRIERHNSAAVWAG